MSFLITCTRDFIKYKYSLYSVFLKYRYMWYKVFVKLRYSKCGLFLKYRYTGETVCHRYLDVSNLYGQPTPLPNSGVCRSRCWQYAPFFFLISRDIYDPFFLISRDIYSGHSPPPGGGEIFCPN